MADDKLEVPSKAQSIEALATGPLASSISKLSGSSRAIPSDQDFHFFLNFDQFSQPLQQIAEKSHSMLESVASSALACAKTASPPAMALPEDIDDAYDRLVDVNDAILERFDASLDELRSYGDGDGFHLVTAKKKKAVSKFSSGDGLASEVVKVATIDKRANGSKPKVPFHIPTIRKPQEEFNIFVCNANKPFDHVWLQRTEDGQRFIHPLENVSVLDFVDDETVDSKTLKPPSVESTEFKLIEEVKDLKELAAKLRGVSEFAVDLEHNQYRSFQGLTCLIQISTRMEDFVIDALKLRIHIGPYLREVFKDPTKRKVMHGADRDIVWLQRDFGIYICNLFDTGQASRVLKLEKNSLEYLLHHFCGVIANKEYQNADWRLRPLPEEMLRYARDDTHYLLHIYDSMKIELHSMKELESPNASLLEVYKRSYDICMQLYEKELLTEDSYLYIYGLRGAGLNSQQLAIVAGLYEWRDVVARAEDESTGYILPNKALIEIAKQMPVTTSTLRRLIKTKHPYVEHNLGSVVSIIRNSMQNATAFEAAVGHLKDGLVGKVCAIKKEPEVSKNNIAPAESILNAESISRTGESCSDKIDSCNSSVANENLCDSASELRKDWSTSTPSDSEQVKGATVQVQKKPSHAFGALLGNKVTKKRFELGGKDEHEAKLKQIRASVHYPFHNIAEPLKPAMEFSVADFEGPISDGQAATSDANSELNDMIILKVDSDIDESGNNYSMTTRNVDNDLKVSASDIDEDEPLSLSDLSLSFQQCLNANRKARRVNKGQESVGLQLKPFDYEAARRQVGFGDRSIEHREEGIKDERSLRGSKLKKNSDGAEAGKDDETAEYLQGRRRKAFPATGNRSATFR